MKLRLFIGILLVVASILKLFTLWGIIDISWLSRTYDEPWATYGVPLIILLVGSDLVYQYMKSKK